MKIRGLLCIIFLMFINVTLAQEINQTNANGEREGVWKKYYQNNRIRYEGQFENGKEVGVFKFYSANTSEFPIVTKSYSETSDEVHVQYFTEKGVPESEGLMVGKERIGKWVYYHPNGKSIMIEEHFENNQLSGSYKLFYPNGKPTKEANYKNGLLHGNSKKYSQNGVLIEDLNYVNGVLNGPAAFYELNGNLKQKGIYEDDLKVGIWQFYTDGELTKSKEIVVTTVKEN